MYKWVMPSNKHWQSAFDVLHILWNHLDPFNQLLNVGLKLPNTRQQQTPTTKDQKMHKVFRAMCMNVGNVPSYSVHWTLYGVTTTRHYCWLRQNTNGSISYELSSHRTNLRALDFHMYLHIYSKFNALWLQSHRYQFLCGLCWWSHIWRKYVWDSWLSESLLLHQQYNHISHGRLYYYCRSWAQSKHP